MRTRPCNVRFAMPASKTAWRTCCTDVCATFQFCAGKGRGVVATQDMKPGALVMVSEPLALLTHPAGERPDTEGLVDWVLEQGKHKHRCGG